MAHVQCRAVVRVIALGQALASFPRGVILRRFAEQHGWPLHYVHRDLKILERVGLPIEGEQARYRLPPNSAPRIQIDVDAEELLAFFIARELNGSLRGTHCPSAGREWPWQWVFATPSARGRHRHPDGAGAARAQGRGDDDDLHARPEPRPWRGTEPGRPAAIGCRRTAWEER